MKKLLSLVLAFSMACSVFAPAVYAAEPTDDPAVELSVTEDGTLTLAEPMPEQEAGDSLPEEPGEPAPESADEPAESPVPTEEPLSGTPAPTMAPEAPAETATPAPTENPAEGGEGTGPAATDTPEATPAPTASAIPAASATPAPTATPTPTATPAPTGEPEATAAPEATAVPEEEVSTLAANAVEEGSIVMYYDADADVYYGKLPAEPNAEGWLQVNSGLTSRWEVNRRDLVYQNGAYWLFVCADAAPEADATYSYTDLTAGETAAKQHPIVFSTEEPAEKPDHLLSSDTYSFLNTDIQYETPFIKAGVEYRVQVDVYGSYYTLVGVEGQGVDVVSGPDENGYITVVFPESVTGWEDESGYAKARFWVYAQSATDGAISYQEERLQYYPEKPVTTYLNDAIYWYDLIQEGGYEYVMNLSYDGFNIDSWSEVGTVENVRAWLEGTSSDQPPYQGEVTAEYNATSDKIVLAVSELPDTSLSWRMHITVDYAEGYTATCQNYVQEKKYLSLQGEEISGPLGLEAGSSATTQVNIWQNNEYTPLISAADEEWTLTPQTNSSILLPEGGELSDYIELSLSADGVLTATLLKPLQLTDNTDNTTLYIGVESALRQGNVAAFTLGMQTVSLGTSPFWGELLSEEGQNFQAQEYRDGAWQYGWKVFGTPTGEVTAVLSSALGDWSEHVSATYDAAQDVVNVKLDALPDTSQNYSWTLKLYVPCAEGYTLLGRTTVNKDTIYANVESVNGLDGIGLTAGSTQTYTLYENDFGERVDLELDDTWTIELGSYSGNFVFAEGEDMADYISAEFVNGKLKLTVLKDITLAQGLDNGVGTFALESPTLRVAQRTFTVGIPVVNIGLVDEQGKNVYLPNLMPGQAMTAYPAVSRNGTDVTLAELGLDYDVEIYWNNNEPFDGWEDYFTIAKNTDGSFTLTVMATPPIYDHASDSPNQYMLAFTSPDGQFQTSVYYSRFSDPYYNYKLRQNGATVYTLPVRAGTYTYEFALVTNDYYNPVDIDLPTDVPVKLNYSLWNGDSSKVEVKLDAATKTLTYTVLEDLDVDNASLSLQGYWGDAYYFSSSTDVGKASIRLSFDRVGDGDDSRFSESGTQFTIIGNTDTGFVPGSKLAAENFTITALENGVEVPLADSAYFDAAIENGVITVTIKQRPDTQSSNNFGIRLSYSDDTYAAAYSQTLSYEPFSGTSSYYTPSFVELSTGDEIEILPVHEPGTVDEYRVMAGDAYATQASNGTLESFRISTTAGFDIDEYINVSFNAANSVLTLEWLKELPLRSEDGSVVYDYTLQPQFAPGVASSIGSVTLFRSANSVNSAQSTENLYTLTVAPGGTGRYRTANPLVADSLWYRVTDANGQPVDTALISAAGDEYGAFSVTAAENCPEGEYEIVFSGIVSLGDGVAAWKSERKDLIVQAQTAEKKVDYLYSYEYQDGLHWGVLVDGDDFSYSTYTLTKTITLKLPEDSPATDFELAGLTLGTAEKTGAGVYVITPDLSKLESYSGTDELTLTAKLADGTTETSTVLFNVNRDDLAFEVHDGNTTYTVAQLLGSSMWVVGKEYVLYPVLNGQKLADADATLMDAFFAEDEYLKVTKVEDHSLTIVPQKAYLNDNYSYGGSFAKLFVSIRKANGDTQKIEEYCSSGTILANGNRLQFINVNTGLKTDRITGREDAEDITLKLSEDLPEGSTVEYGTTVPDSVSWTEDDTPGTVTVHVEDYLYFTDSYFYAIVTRADGSQTSAYASVSWSDSYNYEANMLPTGQRIYFGTKGEDNAFDTWSGNSYIRSETLKTYTNKLYVFYGRQNNNNKTAYEEWPACVEGVEVTSDTPDKVRITRQGLENGMHFFEYQVAAGEYGNYTLTATVTLKDGTTRYATYRVVVCENAQFNNVTVRNGEELETALTSATLLPGMYIYMQPGDYTGDFEADMPVTLRTQSIPAIQYNQDGSPKLRENGATINGSITALVEDVLVMGLDFVGNGTGTALTDARVSTSNIFTGYATALEQEKNIHNSVSLSISNNAFAGNGTALRFVDREWYTYLSNNIFWHNDTAVEYGSGCTIEGQYSPTHGAVMTRGSMIRNVFYLEDGQKALVNASRNQATVNLSYNYFQQGDVTVPQAAMFDGPALYSPFYETADFGAITTDETLEDNVEEGTTTSVLTLTSGQGTSNTNTADSALQLSDSKFDELKESETVTDLQINVQSTSNETDVVWNFAKDDLKEDYEGDSINLGVAFTFTDFEYDTINEIVRKTQEEGGTESETLGSIAYQAMCFTHSGDLPGMATVKVRMNESLLDYYASHGNSMEDFKIYYFNEDSGMLETMDKEIEVVVIDGTYFMQFQIDHCSSYLVTPEDLLTDVSGFIEILLNAANNGGYTLIDAMLERVKPNSLVSEVLSHLSGGAMVVRNLAGEPVDNAAKVGTGFTIGLGDGTIAQVTIVIGGDLNGDSEISSSDMLEMQRAILGISKLEGARLKAATSRSGDSEKPQTTDMLQMRRVLLGITHSMFD